MFDRFVTHFIGFCLLKTENTKQKQQKYVIEFLFLKQEQLLETVSQNNLVKQVLNFVFFFGQANFVFLKTRNCFPEQQSNKPKNQGMFDTCF